jgi:hypothetical protein
MTDWDGASLRAGCRANAPNRFVNGAFCLLLAAGFPTARIRPQDLEVPAFGFDHVSRSTVPFSLGGGMPQRKRWREIPTELSLERFRELSCHT